MVILCICDSSVAKALSEEMRLVTRIFTELESFSFSGFPLRSVTTVKICRLQDLKVLSASAKDSAAFNRASTEYLS